MVADTLPPCIIWSKAPMVFTIRAHATTCRFLAWMRMVRQTVTCWYHGVFRLKFAFYQWTRQQIHNTLIVVDQYLQFMWDKTIPDSVKHRLESFYPLFITSINLPQLCITIVITVLFAMCGLHHNCIWQIYIIYEEKSHFVSHEGDIQYQ